MILIWSNFKQIRPFLMPSFEVKKKHADFGNIPKQTQARKLFQLNGFVKKQIVCHVSMKRCRSLRDKAVIRVLKTLSSPTPKRKSLNSFIYSSIFYKIIYLFNYT